MLAPWFVVWLVSNPLSGLLSVREWQGSALAFSAFEFALRLGSMLIGARHGSPMLAVARPPAAMNAKIAAMPAILPIVDQA